MNDKVDNSFAQKLLQSRGRRTVATLLSYMEERVWPHIPEELQKEARSKIMRVVGDYQDLASDAIAADTGAINEYWIDELVQIHDKLDKL